MLDIDSISLQYGPKIIFDEISANITARDRIALVGSNGAGKSTLLKIILNQVEPDSGRINRANYVTVGYLPQDGIVSKGKPLYKEVESAFEDILSIKAQIVSANARLDELSTHSEEYYDLLDVLGALEHRLEDLDAARLKSKIETVLLGLGFHMEDMDRDCGEFSGGWQMRIALAKLLLREPSLLLMDEPTNHLDLPSQRWLERYLKRYEGALIIISHDRAFLDELCNRTFALSMGNLEIYAGNYSYFEKESVARKELLLKAYKNQQKEIEKTQDFINRFRYKASKAKQVQSRIKALDKKERIEIENEESRIKFSFPKAPHSGHKVVELINVSKAYDDFVVFKNLNFRLERGDRVAIVGANGAGKTTLAKVVAGIELLTTGERIVGNKVSISYFAQHQADAMDPEKTVLETIEQAGLGIPSMPYRSILGAFLFRGDDVFKKTKVLSGGEKCRLALASLLVQKANFLILDEPTNHLDMKSKKMLQEALIDYEGCILVVSHDRAFLDPLVNKVLEVSKNGTRMFLGNVSEYLEKIEDEEKNIPHPEQNQEITKNVISPKEKRKQNVLKRESLEPLRKKNKELEEIVQKLEKRKTELETLMLDPNFFSSQNEETQKALQEHQQIEKLLEKRMEEWLESTEQLAKLDLEDNFDT